jgi:purine-binding chemotaxis protein CheW
MESIYDQSPQEQFVLFAIADYRFALPIQKIFQVVYCPPPFNNELNQMGLVQLGDQVLQMVDLHQRLNFRDGLTLADSPTFFVITYDLRGDLYGIPVYETPDLIEISPEMLRSLPYSEHQPDVLKIASQLALVPWQGGTKTVLLLDMQRVLNRTSITAASFLPEALA